MELVEFTWGALGGGVLYDGVKMILASSFDKLKSFVDENNKGEFKIELEKLLLENKDLKSKLEQFKIEKKIDIKVDKGVGYVEIMHGDISF